MAIEDFVRDIKRMTDDAVARPVATSAESAIAPLRERREAEDLQRVIEGMLGGAAAPGGIQTLPGRLPPAPGGPFFVPDIPFAPGEVTENIPVGAGPIHPDEIATLFPQAPLPPGAQITMLPATAPEVLPGSGGVDAGALAPDVAAATTPPPAPGPINSIEAAIANFALPPEEQQFTRGIFQAGPTEEEMLRAIFEANLQNERAGLRRD